MVDADTFLLALIGYPLGHTLSPRLHQAALAAAGLNGVYLALPTPPEHLADAVRGVRAWKLRGLNVTIPHKVAVIPLLDGLTARAERVGAVNTLYWEGDRLMGDNTDVAGVKALSAGLAVEGRRVIVLGAGGSARSVGVALGELGAAEVVFLVRRPGAAQALVSGLTEAFPATRALEQPWEAAEELLPAADLLFNTTPIGMEPNDADSPLTPDQVALLPGHAAVLDLIYRPAMTRLMRMAAERGLVARNGLAMLVAQAQAAFERWTGRHVPLDVWERSLEGLAER
ncbi:MAG TPA: shikimate dehydrogenase [Stenomitos sp.]